MKNRTLLVLTSLFIIATSALSATVPAPEDQLEPSVAASSNGYFVVWADKRNPNSLYDIYGARVSRSGEVLDPEGIPICTDARQQTFPRVAFNGNEFLVVWEDERESGTNFLLFQIYGARVTTDGRVLDTNGFKITANQTNRTGPAVASDGNGFFAVWVEWNSLSNSIADISGSAISADGVVANPEGISLVQAPQWQTDPRIAYANGEYLVTYVDSSQIRGLRIATNGTALSSSFAISSQTANDRHGLASNGRDYFEVWGDYRNSPPGVGYPDVYGTLILSNGIVLNPGGIPISTNGYYAERPQIASDGQDFVAVWEESNDPANALIDIYGARLTADGQVGGPARISVNRSPGVQMNPDIAYAGTNFLAVWQDGRSQPGNPQPYGAFDIYGTLVSGHATALNTNGFLISSAQATNHPPTAFSQSLTATQATWLLIPLTASDPDNDPLSYRLVTLPSLGTLTGAPPNLLYISTTNFSTIVTDSFMFVANDGLVDSAPATVSIALFPQMSNSNTLPVLSLITTDLVASEALNPDGTTNTANFNLRRSGDPTNELPVSLSVHGSATYGSDYYTVPALIGLFSNSVTTVTMPAGATSMVFTIYPIPDNVTEGTESAIFALNSSSNYVVGAPSQISVSILDSNPPPVTGTRVIFPPNGANYASTLDIKLRISNTNVSSVKLYSDDQLLASFSSAPPIFFLILVTNFPVGAHTVYSVANEAVTSAPVHFNVLAPLEHNPLTPKLGIAPEANASFFIDSNGALFDWGDGRYGALADGGFTNQEQNTVTRPIQIPLPAGTNRFVKVSSGSRHTLALTSDGSLYTCGDNSSGQTGTHHSTSTFEGFVTIPEFAGWKDIAAGNFHSLALQVDGRLTACGNNSFGQLGLGNSTTNGSVFQQVPFPAGVTAFTAIGAGSNYSIALGNNGQLYACGLGLFGTLGNGGTTNSSVLVPVALPAGVTNWLKVFAGAQHVLAIAGNGALYAWGLGSSGQLGNGGTSVSTIPRLVTLPDGVTNWLDLAAGINHSLGLAANGNLYSWGFGPSGQLGPGSPFRTIPTLVPPPTNVISWKGIGAGINHSLGIGDDCKLYSWGANNLGQLGTGSLISQTNETLVQNLSSGVCASPSNQPPFAFSQSLISTQRSVLPITLTGSDPDNDLLTFRIITPPSLGVLTGAPPTVLYLSTTNFLTTVTDAFTFVANDGFTDSAPATVSITLFPMSGPSNTGPVISITSTDTIASELRNPDGTTNTGNFTIRRTGTSSNVVQVVLIVGGTATYGLDYYTVPPLNVTSNSHTTFITTSGPGSIPFMFVPLNDMLNEGTEFASFTIGSNSSYTIGSPGQTTLSILDSSNVPPASTRIFFPTDRAQFASPFNIEIRVANTNIGTLKVYADSNLLATATAPPTGGSFVFSIVTNFSIGGHTVYSVGNNSVTSAPVHFAVFATNFFNQHFVTLGKAPVANSSFIVANGALYDWGDDRYGNLGDGGLSNAGPTGVTVPIQMPLPKDLRIITEFPTRWMQVSSGGRHTLALDTLGSLYVAGDNSLGQTGNPTNTSQGFFTPAFQFPAPMAWKDIAAGGLHSLALTTSGQLYAWGYNAFGQLGNGSNTTVLGPTLVPLPAGVTNWTAIAAGTNHSLALGNDGNIYAWGRGLDGVLGNGGTTNSSRPQRVVRPVEVTAWVKIAAGANHSLALGNNGKLYAWGLGSSGQLGNGTTANSAVPVPVSAPPGVLNWRAISGGITHSLGIGDDGNLYAWGTGLQGQLGPNAGAGNAFRPTPVLVPRPDSVSSWNGVSAGALHSLGLGDNCTLYSWGANSFGQLGIGSFVGQTNLQAVENIGDLCVSPTTTNHAPSFVKGPDITVPEDSGLQVVTNWATSINPGAPSETNQILTFIVTNDNHTLFSTQPGITPSGNLYFAGAHNSNGVAHVTIVLKDNGGTANGGRDTSAPQTFLITITPVNDTPVAHSASVTVNEDTAIGIHLNASDPDGDALTDAIVTPPSHGSLTGTAPDVTYLGSANYNGPDSFTFKVNDGQVDSELATISISVLSVNDPPMPVVRVFPSFVLSSNYSAFQVISPNNSNAVVYFDASLSTDADGDPLTFGWFDDGTNHLFGSGVVATNTLDLGTNSIILTVSDGHVTEFKPFEVDVISAGGAIGELMEFIKGLPTHSGIKPKTWKQLTDVLRAAQSEFERGNWNAGLVHLRIFRFRVSTQIAPVDQALANNLMYMAQQIATAVQGSVRHQPSIARLTDRGGKGKSLTFIGMPGRFYFVQASGDLLRWETIGIASETDTGAYHFDDSVGSDAAARFYRLVVP
jgi:alpha-tubulin suppressor-like RCC1 family protein